VTLKDGYLEIPETPGLGVELDPEGIPDRPIRNWRRSPLTGPDGAPAFL
jgi:L-alanine-DL-glutamate epimerase-like enolase superfamily enzyme